MSDSLRGRASHTVVTRREHTLVTHGPYRWVRHSFYGVAFLGVLAFSLMAANWFLALVYALYEPHLEGHGTIASSRSFGIEETPAWPGAATDSVIRSGRSSGGGRSAR
jgi:hypothetical protein